MTHASLFSGIGGFDLAAEWAGGTNLFNCEIDPFCQTILKFHFPDAEQYDNIRAADFAVWRGRVDVLSGGFPCQPFSQAGKRKGTEDDRYLWPTMLRAIREIAPRWVVGENVLGIINWSDGMVFEQVCADLEAAGYEVQPFVLPAAGVGAPHQRYRTWFVAYDANSPAAVRGAGEDEGAECEERLPERDDVREPGQPNDVRRLVTYAERDLHRGAQRGGAGETQGLAQFDRKKERPAGEPCRADQYDDEGRHGDQYVTDTYGNERHERGMQPPGCETAERYTGSCYSWNGRHPWQNFPTQPPVCSRDDGFSGIVDIVALLGGRPLGQPHIRFGRWRQESIKVYGNAIVPQVALQMFDAINQYENLK